VFFERNDNDKTGAVEEYLRGKKLKERCPDDDSKGGLFRDTTGKKMKEALICWLTRYSEELISLIKPKRLDFQDLCAGQHYHGK
jgi:hypothetical protein